MIHYTYVMFNASVPGLTIFFSNKISATPTGRIVNRFSKDVYTLDGKLVSTMRAYFSTLANVFATIIVVT